MKNVVRFGAVISLLALTSVASFAGIVRAKRPVANSYIVVLKPGANVEHTARALEAVHRGKVKHIWTKAVEGFSIQVDETAAVRISEHPLVQSVEENSTLELSTTQTVTSDNWHLDRADQRSVTRNLQYTYCQTGSAVKIYVVDTGVLQNHAEFSTGRVISGVNYVDDGYSETAPCQDTHNLHGVPYTQSSTYILNGGHGTAIASAAAGNTWGVAKQATIVPVRAFDCNAQALMVDVIDGIDWIIINHAANAPAVANMSFNYPYSGASALETAVNNLIADGVTVVTSANNQNDDACAYSPSRVANAITVAASTVGDARWSASSSLGSNSGTCVDLFAPGHEIYSAGIMSNYAVRPISDSSGTSFSAALVSGAAAQYLQNNTTATPSAVWTYISGRTTNNVITNSGTGSPNKLLYIGCD